MRGTCVWFNRSFGFLRDEASGKDYFVHFTGISGEGYRTLLADDKVEFEIDTRKEDGRVIAVNVRVLEKANGNGSSPVHRKQ